MAEPIEIIIRKGEGGTGTGFGIPGAELSSAALNRGSMFGKEGETFLKNNSQDDADRFNKSVIAFIIANTKRAINYGISQYGDMTGNYIQQAEFQLANEMLNNMLAIGGAFIGGTVKTGNPIIGAIAAGFTAGSIGVGYGFQYQSLQRNIQKLDTYSNIMQERSGNTYNNGSRGTEY